MDSRSILVGFFSPAFGLQSDVLPLFDVFKLIDDPPAGDHWLLVVASLREDDLDDEERRKKKRALPAVTFQAVWITGKRDGNEPWEHSGLVVLDFDHVDNPEAAKDLLLELGALFAFLSPSGDGVKAVFLLDIKPETTHEHLLAWQVCAARCADAGLEADPSGKDVARLTYLSHDPDIAVATKKTPIPWKNGSPFQDGIEKGAAAEMVPGSSENRGDDFRQTWTEAAIDSAMGRLDPSMPRSDWISVCRAIAGAAALEAGLSMSAAQNLAVAWSRDSDKFVSEQDVLGVFKGWQPSDADAKTLRARAVEAGWDPASAFGRGGSAGTQESGHLRGEAPAPPAERPLDGQHVPEPPDSAPPPIANGAPDNGGESRPPSTAPSTRLSPPNSHGGKRKGAGRKSTRPAPESGKESAMKAASTSTSADSLPEKKPPDPEWLELQARPAFHTNLEGVDEMLTGHLQLRFRKETSGENNEFFDEKSGLWLPATRAQETRWRKQLSKECAKKGRKSNTILEVPAKAVEDLVEELADLNRVDSFFCDFLDRIPPFDPDKDPPLLDSLIGDVFDAADNEPELLVWASRFLYLATYQRGIGANAELLGAELREDDYDLLKLDEMPVLDGPQGCGKSFFVRMPLAPRHRRRWFGDGLNLAGPPKERIEAVLRNRIIEVTEMVGLGRADLESLKKFMTQTHDGGVRLAYRRESMEPMPRHWCAMGTANGLQLPNDPSGNRRFIPVKVRLHEKGVKHLVRYMRTHREKLWAEARWMFEQGERASLPASLQTLAADIQETYRNRDDLLEDAIDTYLEGKGKKRTWFTIQDVVEGAELVEPGRKPDRAMVRAVSKYLTSVECGLTRDRRMIDKVRTFRFHRPGT